MAVSRERPSNISKRRSHMSDAQQEEGKIVKPEHEAWIKENIENGEALMKSDDPNELLVVLDDMMLESLDENYRPTERTGEIARVYDDAYSDMK